MRRLSGVLFLASFGLAVGCGDDGMNTSATTASTTQSTVTTLTTATATETGTGTGTDSTTPTSSDGTASSSETGTSGPTTGGTDTTGQVMTTTGSTDPMTSTTTNNMTTMTGSTTEEPCQELMVTLQPVKPNTMLVLDKSGSMLQTWDHDLDGGTPNVTRWYSLYAVVDQILTGFNDSFNFGMNLFPSTAAKADYSAMACPVNNNVEVPVAAMNQAAIIAALPAQNNMSIAGGTPTAKGMTAALNHLKTLDPNVPRVVILVTDGAANCTTTPNMVPNDLFELYDPNLAPIVGDAYTVDGIPTYVIGIAISNALTPNQQDGNPNGINPYEKLNELATLGGTAKPGNEKFYSADNQIELSAALEAIVNAAFSCVIPLEAPPAFPDDTVVKVGGVVVPKINDCANENGWTYLGPEPYQQIELCGTACADLKIAGDADVEYYCDAG